MKSNYLVNTCIDIATKYKTLYVYGCFGAPLNAKNKQRYTHNYAYNERPERTKKILAASDNTFGFDCVCLIKGILWGWNGDVNATYGGATYPNEAMIKQGACPDVDANTLFNKYCYDKSKDFSNVKPGEFVWMNGHIGVAITDKLAVECTPIWKDGVQITSMNCDVKGYNRRNWTSHGKSKFIDYSDTPKPEPEPTPTPITLKYKVGDKVKFTGRLYGTAYGENPGQERKDLVCTITRVYDKPGATKPYNIDNDLGWVSQEDLTPYIEQAPITKEISLGDTVIVNGVGTSSSTGEGSRTKKFTNQKMKVIMIAGNVSRPNRYALNQYNKGNVNDPRAVTGWFSINNIKKV